MNLTVDLCAVPAAVSPNGKHNFVNPPSLGPTVIAVGVVLAAVSTVFAVGRLYVKRNKLDSADYFTLIACVANIALSGVTCTHQEHELKPPLFVFFLTNEHRYYRHYWDIPVCWYSGAYLRLTFVQTLLFCPTFFFAKGAIFLLYRQLFAVKTRFKAAVDAGLTITLLVYLSMVPLAVIYAAPRADSSWDGLLDKFIVNARFIALAGIVQSAVGTLIDFYMFFLPLPILLHLHIPLRQRLQLVAVFSTALLAVAASVASLVIKIEFLSSTDSAWLAALISVCSLIEASVAIIVGCMPACAHFLTPQRGASKCTLFNMKSLLSRLRLYLKLGSDLRGASANMNQSESNEQTHAPRRNQELPRRMKYYELTDTALLETQTTRRDDEHQQQPDQVSQTNSSPSIQVHVRTMEHMA
ncbi:hypothetical protein HIM_08666 [Hirsutella minnesotensis 3608]|uniref:Rhodopsin domain-containing protein n=1 Tax=Hirsutella minnesotensis 3608 TaxID=1043627 RepID=A0A0F7ZMC2_9HYPO|nr:hypothetical protein HIM_08666 [Hirsutella minnesotensis 3608]